MGILGLDLEDAVKDRLGDAHQRQAFMLLGQGISGHICRTRKVFQGVIVTQQFKKPFLLSWCCDLLIEEVFQCLMACEYCQRVPELVETSFLDRKDYRHHLLIVDQQGFMFLYQGLAQKKR